MDTIEVRQCDKSHGVDEGKWGLFLEGVLLGSSKQRFDADHAKQVLLKWATAYPWIEE
jgi:hypothetical protein